ncbi:MAG TPA: LamG domain-containing protein [Sedimentisphaerales bacterium]|nr:LamG domain-containing protein [Sedimentisphaerales bacterium]
MYKKLIYLTYFGLVLGLIQTNAANAADPNLVGWWKFDDGSGTTAVDSSGNGNDGALMGDPQWVAGWIDGALELDGNGDYVDLPIGPLIPTLEETTFTLWVNWSGGGGAWQRIIDLGTGTSSYIYVTPIAGAFGDALHVSITNGNSLWDEFSSSEGTLATGWHHIALTVSVSSGTMVMYLDGEVVGSMEDMTNSISGLGETTQNWIGRSQYEDPYFNGSLDDFRIYNHVLSEIDLHAIAVENFRQAWKPGPADGEMDVLLNQRLIWNPGILSDETFELYNEHHVYIGTDFNDVSSATVSTATMTDANEYAASLDYDTAYYWRTDEVSSLDPSSPVKGKVWSFTTANFIVVEDFEDYNDFEPYTVYFTWIDGWNDPTNGATSGYPNPIFGIGEHYMETTIVHGGEQSMPLFYDNSAGLSEVTKTLNADWTQDDVVTLTLFYYGDASNAIEPMYVAVNGSAVVANDDPKAVLANDWIQWNIPLQEFADQGVNLANVDTLSIGLGNKADPQAGGGTGHVFFDDIRLYRSLPEEPEPGPEPVDPGTDNLVAYYAFENNTQDGSGNGYNATTSGNPQYVSGPTGYGMAMEFDGTGDYVRLPIGSAIAVMNNITVSTWANLSNLGGAWQRLWDFGSSDQIYMFVTPRIGTDGELRFAVTAAGNVTETNITAPATLPSGWHHVAASIDSSSMTMKLYQDGKLVAEGPTPLLPSDLGETTENYLGRSQFAADAYYFGSLDEFRIYNRALSEGEVLYLAGK